VTDPRTEPARFHKQAERELYAGHVISLGVGTFVAPDGTRFERDLVHHPGAVSVVPVLGDEVVLVRQYRASIDGYLLEIPAGKRDVADEPPERTAHRELIEEVGLRAATLVPLAEFYNSPGFCDEHSFVYLALDLEPVPASAQGVEEEHMHIERVVLDEVMGLIARRELMDAKSIIGLTLALAHLGR
jgi:8-oxo-dGTP pyrophosphatase MutT (NUDIX family)